LWEIIEAQSFQQSDLEVPAGQEEERVARVPSVEDVTNQEVVPDGKL